MGGGSHQGSPPRHLVGRSLNRFISVQIPHPKRIISVARNPYQKEGTKRMQMFDYMLLYLSEYMFQK